MFDQDIQIIGTCLREQLQKAGLADPPAIEWSPVPFSGQWGWGTSVCLKAAAALTRAGKSSLPVPQQAQKLAEQIASGIQLPAGFSRIDAVRGYVNVYFDTRLYIQRVLETVLRQGVDFGHGDLKGERVMVEYAQPNTHHSFHVGHLRNAVLGESLSRIADFAGFETIRASYPGDIGLGVIKCIWAYRKFYSGQEPEGALERGRWLAQIYTESNSLLETHPDESEADRAQREQYEVEIRDMYRLWDTGDSEIRALWMRTRQWSLDELDEILRQLDIQVDVFFYESDADELGKQIVDDLISRDVAVDERASGGPVIVHIDEKLGITKETFRTAVILRSDNTSLYLTKDLALAKIKFENYHVDRSIYVVDVRQSLHFQQAFKILELMGFPQATKCFHLAYEIVTLPEGTMSSRKGNVVYYADVVAEATRRVSAIIAEKNPELAGPEREETAFRIGLGALKYAMLAVDNTKQIVFSWETALSFDGQAAPYIQYAHVRAVSILERTGIAPIALPVEYEPHPSEVALVDLISRFPTEVQRAANDYKPLHMANYSYVLAKAFTEFYRECPVMKEEGNVRATRVALVAAARQTLENSLRLLGIHAPAAM
jgi:arginyl-tRNA synthetase